MCTVSWVHDVGGYHILCNRDEKLSRLPARAPAIESLLGVRYIAPRDVAGGGTWMSVNEFGVSLCLLNGVGPTPNGARSRGAIVTGAAAAKSAQAAMESIAGSNIASFAPFQIVAVDARGRSCLFIWDGAHSRIVDDAASSMPLTSSSFDTAQVCFQRRRYFTRLCGGGSPPTPECLFDFHCSHDGSPSAYSTCMHRDDAATVSFSWVTVRAHEIRYFYSPSAPCQWTDGEAVTLEVRQ